MNDGNNHSWCGPRLTASNCKPASTRPPVSPEPLAVRLPESQFQRASVSSSDGASQHVDLGLGMGVVALPQINSGRRHNSPMVLSRLRKWSAATEQLGPIAARRRAETKPRQPMTIAVIHGFLLPGRAARGNGRRGSASACRFQMVRELIVLARLDAHFLLICPMDFNRPARAVAGLVPSAQARRQMCLHVERVRNPRRRLDVVFPHRSSPDPAADSSRKNARARDWLPECKGLMRGARRRARRRCRRRSAARNNTRLHQRRHRKAARDRRSSCVLAANVRRYGG